MSVPTMSRRTFLRRSVALGAVSAALAACAPPAPAPAPATQSAATTAPAAPAKEPTKAAQPVKIRGTVWVSAAELDALGKLTEAYQKTTPSAQVEWINIQGGGPYGRDKLQTMIAGGDAPDVMMLNTGQFEGLGSRGALLALDSFVDAEKFDLGIYWPQAVSGCKYKGKLYGLPRDISNVILYYNKDLFDKAGVKYPTADWTWNDMLAACKTLTRDNNGDGKTDQWGFAFNNIVWVWAGFVWGNGGDVLDADRTKCLLEDPKTLEALDFYFGLITKQQVAPPPGALPQAPGSSAQMLGQSTAMGLFGPWFRPSLVGMEKPFKWDVSYPPKAPKTGNRGSVVYTDHWGLYATSKVAKDAWDFIKFLTSKDGQTLWVKLIGARSISPVKAVAQTPEWLGYGGSSGQIILDCLSFSQAPPVNFGNANEAETIWNEEFGFVVAGQKTVQQAAADACKRLGPVLGKG